MSGLDWPGEERRRPPPADDEADDGEWPLFLPFGRYEVEALLGPGDTRRETFDARPPMFRVVLGRP